MKCLAVGSKTTTTNSILQEKLSHYLDRVEVDLVAEISRKSSEFFAALTNIQSLHTQTSHCLVTIREIRHYLGSIDYLLNSYWLQLLDTVALRQTRNGLEIVRMKRRRTNLVLLFNTIVKVLAIVDAPY